MHIIIGLAIIMVWVVALQYSRSLRWFTGALALVIVGVCGWAYSEVAAPIAQPQQVAMAQPVDQLPNWLKYPTVVHTHNLSHIECTQVGIDILEANGFRPPICIEDKK